MYCLQECMCAVFSPEILQDGAVKGLKSYKTMLTGSVVQKDKNVHKVRNNAFFSFFFVVVAFFFFNGKVQHKGLIFGEGLFLKQQADSCSRTKG